MIRIPCSASAGRDPLAVLASVRGVELADPLGDPGQHLGGGEAVRAAGVDPGLDLVVDAGHPDHEELVEVRDEDGEELHPLDQRQRLVAGELRARGR